MLTLLIVKFVLRVRVEVASEMQQSLSRFLEKLTYGRIKVSGQPFELNG